MQQFVVDAVICFMWCNRVVYFTYQQVYFFTTTLFRVVSMGSGNLFYFEEEVIFYPVVDFEHWKAGDKWLVPEGRHIPRDLYNQKSGFFGEFYALQHYMRQGWQGYHFYGLGNWEPNNPKYFEGKNAVKQVINAEALARFDELLDNHPKGEPDLFLFKMDGSAKFVEVKRDGDTTKPDQLTCLAQIK